METKKKKGNREAGIFNAEKAVVCSYIQKSSHRALRLGRDLALQGNQLTGKLRRLIDVDFAVAN